MIHMKNQARILYLMFAAVVIIVAVILCVQLGSAPVDVSSDMSLSASSEKSMNSSDTTSDSHPTSIDESDASVNLSDEPTESREMSTGSVSETTEQSQTSEEPSSETSNTSHADTNDREVPASITREEGKKYIAFTFDDGPSIYTPKILDKLEEWGQKATFFVVGNRLENETYGSYVRRAVSLGCEIGNHSYSHEYYWNKCSDSIYKSELEKTDNLIRTYAGYLPILMRPPGGSISQKRADESIYNIIIWSVDSEDWKHKGTSDKANNINTIVNNIMSNVGNGDIILMHDLYENSYEAWVICAERLMEKGYEFVTVAELCSLNDTDTVGVRYWSEKYNK